MNTRIESNRQPRSLNESGKPCSRIRPIAFLFVFRNIGQVLSLFSPYLCSIEIPIESWKKDNARRVSEVCERSGRLYQSPLRWRNWPEITGQDFPFLSFLFSPHHESFFRRARRYFYRPDTHRGRSPPITLLIRSDSWYCLPDRICFSILFLQNIQTDVWYFTNRIS